VVLSSPAIESQVLTGRIYNGWGTMNVNGTELTDGQMVTVRGGAVVNVSGISSQPGVTVWGWVSDDGQFLSPKSNSTTLTVRNAPSGVGNVTLLLNATPSQGPAPKWVGLQFSGTDYIEASGTFSIPYVNPQVCEEGACTSANVGIWVGIGGTLGTKNLWQAGVCVVNASSCPSGGPGSSGVAAYAWYETYPQANPFYNDIPLIVGSTVTVTVTYNATNSTGTFDVVCDSKGGSGCGWSSPTWSGQVSYTPDTSTCEWIAEYIASYNSWSFWAPSSTSASGLATSFSASAAVYDGYVAGEVRNQEIWDFVESVGASNFMLKT